MPRPFRPITCSAALPRTGSRRSAATLQDYLAEEANYPAGRVHNVGGVRHDVLDRRIRDGQERRRAARFRSLQAGSAHGARIVLLALTTKEEVDTWLGWLLPIVEHDPDVLLVVKPHRHFRYVRLRPAPIGRKRCCHIVCFASASTNLSPRRTCCCAERRRCCSKPTCCARPC